MIFKKIFVFTLKIESGILDLHNSETNAKPLVQRFSGAPVRFAHQNPGPDWKP